MKANHTWNKIAAFVLCAALMLSMLPVTSLSVHAATKAVCNTFAELQTAVADDTVDVIEIGSDFEVTEMVMIQRTVTIQGVDGKTPKLTANVTTNPDALFKLSASDDITVTFANLTIDGNGSMKRGITVIDAYCVLNAGVTIQNCTEYGILSVGTTEMNAGVKIWHNNIGVCAGGLGPAIFIMNGGTIEENNGGKGTDVGGGVYNLGVFTMNAGTIRNNQSKYNGAGVRQPGDNNRSSVKFTMNGGQITGNSTTKKGGGIYHGWAEKNSVVELKGGSITNNTAQEAGGGIYYYKSVALRSISLQMSGAITVTGNTVNGSPNNVELDAWDPIEITGALTGKIGVLRDPASTVLIAKGSGYEISEDDLAAFQSDNEDYTLALSYSGNIVLKECGTLSASDFVFTPPQDLVWDDAAKEVTVTPRTGLACGAITVKYYDSTGAALASAPKAPGTYSVKIDVAKSNAYKAATDLFDANWSYTILPDTTAPQISGIADNQTYCGAVTATVTDRNLKAVTVDGSPVTLQGNQFTVAPKTGVQKITALDQAGNQTTVAITVNAGHTPGEWVIDEAPSYTKDGSRHKTCTVCGTVTERAGIPKLTPDATPAKPEIQNPAKTDQKDTAKTDQKDTANTDAEKKYKVIEGADATYTVHEDGSVTMRANGKYKKFKGVMIDDKTVDSKNYTAWSGSTYVKFKKKFVESLSVGKHTVKLLFTDGYAKTSLTIAEKKVAKTASEKKATDTKKATKKTDTKSTDSTQGASPKTGDAFQPEFWMGALCIFAAGLMGIAEADKKRRKSH